MKRFLLFTFLLPLLIPVFVTASDFNDTYGEITTFLEYLQGENSNTGQTVFPILEIPVGGKSAGMGSVGTAVAYDTSSLLYNPASAALLDLTELAFLHNNWIADSYIDGIAFTKRFDDLGIAATGNILHLNFTSYDSYGEGVAKGTPFEAVASVTGAYNLFRSYYFNGISAGLSLKAAYHHIPEIFYAEQSSAAFAADVGLLSSFNFLKFYSSRDKNFSIGAAFKNLGFETITDPEPLPTEFSAGIAYQPVRPFKLAFDFDLPVSLDPEVEAETPGYALGFNSEMTDFFSFHGGAFLSTGAGSLGVALGSTINLEKVVYNINYTYDPTTSSTDILNRFSITAKLKLGDEGRYEKQQRVDELYIAGLEAYASGDLEKAIAYWQAALDLDNSFTPAEEFLASASRSVNLLEQMQELNKVD